MAAVCGIWGHILNVVPVLVSGISEVSDTIAILGVRDHINW